MTKTNRNHKRLLGLAVKIFIIASVLAVVLPLPEYARGLSDEEYIVWLARVIWVLMLAFGVCVLLPMVGLLVSKIKNKTQKTDYDINT